MIHPQYVELAGSAAYMGICFAFAGATKVVNAAQEVQQSVGKIERRINVKGATEPGRRYKNRIPDQGTPGSVLTNPAGTTRKKYGSDGRVQKEFNKGHGNSKKIPKNKRNDHIHDYKPNPYHPDGKPLRQPGRPVRNKDKVDFGLFKNK